MPMLAPPLPERVRTLAAVAVPTHVSCCGSARPATRIAGGVDRDGRPVLLAMPGHHLHGAPDGLQVTVDLIAHRKVGTVHRPRGMLKARGRLEPVPHRAARHAAVAVAEHYAEEALFEVLERPDDPHAPRLLRLIPEQVTYLIGRESGTLDGDAYLAASPDPLIEPAERIIRHVNARHIAPLRCAVTRLAGPVKGEVWLWELDRFGATVRVGLDDPILLRLPWPRPAATRLELELSLHQVLYHP